MNKTYKDTDLREALHRKYADTPQLPADFMAKMEQRMEEREALQRQNRSRHTMHLWRWVAAAACILLIIGIGVTMMPAEQEGDSEILMAQRKVPASAPTPATEQPSDSERPFLSQQEAVSLTAKGRVANPSRRTESLKVNHGDGSLDPSSGDCDQENRPHDSDPDALYDPNLHYASNDLTKDTVPYQDPARVDDFIAKLAANYDVKQGGLKCSESVESNVVSTVYVFPDTKEIDVFGRLLQVACWYKSETPGYRLNFSQQQFFFELKDMRKQLQYRWIAERINGKILLYGTNAPIGVTEFSTCYQEYRNELMHINSINIKTKKI